MGIHRRRVTLWTTIAQGLFEGAFEFVEQQIHALLQALVLKHQRIARHDARHTRIFFCKLQNERHHSGHLRRTCRFAIGNLTHKRKHRLLDEINQTFKHLRFAGEVTVQSRLTHAQLGRQSSGGNALSARLLQHARQGLQNLQTALARLGALACGRGGSLIVFGQMVFVAVFCGHGMLPAQWLRIMVPKA